MRRCVVVLGLVLVFLGGLTLAQEPVDLQMVSRIRAEGLQNSQAMQTLSYLTDVAGPRLSGSPGLMQASEWSRDQLKDWGLVNAALEPWGIFGQGWALKKLSVEMTAPYYSPIIAFPQAWTEGTGGRVVGQPMLLDVSSPEDLEQYKGKLAGKIIMLPSNREAETHFEADATRRSEDSLDELAQAPVPGEGGGFSGRRAEFRRLRAMRNRITAMLREEKVAAIIQSSRGEHGTLFIGGAGSRDIEDPKGIPTLMMAIEHHARIERLIEKNIPVELAIDIETEFYGQDLQGYNVVAEIPGTDPQIGDEIVMLGGHIDSWHGATGAADNAAGVTVAMEAVRILKALNVSPRRTIRIGLWSGEEQGLLGSRGYVGKHFGDRESMALMPDHEKLSAYFNLDNGTGKIRGVYLQGNDAVRPIFEAWLKPFHDMGADTLTIRNTGGTDHLAFDAVGLPGFQFIQDQIDYNTRTHHTNMDFWDHVIEGDIIQASIIMASFVYHAAQRDEKLPRKALPSPSGNERRRPSGGQ